MYSMTPSKDVTPRTIVEMENSFMGFKKPTGFPVRSTVKPKRLADMDMSVCVSSSKKNNQFMPRNATTSKKHSFNKPSLSQSMSTSKRLTTQKRNNQNIFKNSINFTNILKDENNFIKSDFKKKTANKPDFAVNGSSKFNENTDLKRNSRGSKSSMSKSLLSQFNDVSKPPTENHKLGDTTLMKKKSFKKQTKFDISTTSIDSLSDKENDECVQNKSFYDKFSDLLGSQFEELHNLDTSNVSKKCKSLLQKNLMICEKIMQLSLKLVDNNVKLSAAIAENDKSESSQQSVRNGAKKSKSRSPLKSIPIDVIGGKYSKDPADDLNLRKVASFNSSKYSSSVSTSKKSVAMYNHLKTSMDILKTPKANNTIVMSDFETPNTKCKIQTSQNVQKQLQKLFD